MSFRKNRHDRGVSGKKAREEAAQLIRNAGIPISKAEASRIEVLDFALNHPEIEGAQILPLVSTDRISVKVIALFPLQTEPEHWHPSVDNDPGKEETIRVLSGEVRFYLEGGGQPIADPLPVESRKYYTVARRVLMNPGDQLTIDPGIKHWFQAGPDGAVVFSFSSVARDALDLFTNPNIVRSAGSTRE